MFTTFTRFKTPEMLLDVASMLPRLAANGFTPIDALPDVATREGWVHWDDLTKSDFQPDNELHQFHKLLPFRLRIDKRNISPALFKLRMKDELTKWSARTGRIRPTKLDKIEIEEALRKVMTSQTLPTPKTYNALWTTHAGAPMVLFGTTGAAAVSGFAKLFTETLQIELTAIGPVALAEKWVAGYADRAWLIEQLRQQSNMAFTLGREFLLWLIARSEMSEDPVEEMEFVTVCATDGGGSKAKITGQSLPEDCSAVRAALHCKMPTEARFRIEISTGDLLFTLNDKLQFKAVKMPKVPSEDKSDEAAMIADAVGNIGRIVNAVDDLFAEFMSIRTDEAAWEEREADIQLWIQGDTVTT